MEIQFIYKVASREYGESRLEPVIFFDLEKAIAHAQKIEDECKGDDNFMDCIIYKERPSLDDGCFRTVGTISFIHKEDLK